MTLLFLFYGTLPQLLIGLKWTSSIWVKDLKDPYNEWWLTPTCRCGLDLRTLLSWWSWFWKQSYSFNVLLFIIIWKIIRMCWWRKCCLVVLLRLLTMQLLLLKICSPQCDALSGMEKQAIAWPVAMWTIYMTTTVLILLDGYFVLIWDGKFHLCCPIPFMLYAQNILILIFLVNMFPLVIFVALTMKLWPSSCLALAAIYTIQEAPWCSRPSLALVSLFSGRFFSCQRVVET